MHEGNTVACCKELEFTQLYHKLFHAAQAEVVVVRGFFERNMPFRPYLQKKVMVLKCTLRIDPSGLQGIIYQSVRASTGAVYMKVMGKPTRKLNDRAKLTEINTQEV